MHSREGGLEKWVLRWELNVGEEAHEGDAAL